MALWRPSGGGLFLMSEVPLYPTSSRDIGQFGISDRGILDQHQGNERTDLCGRVWAAAERIWHTQDSQGHILALAFR